MGSLRIWVPWIQAGFVMPERSTADSEAMTRAHAPSEDGHVSSYRMGSHSICDASTESTVVSGFCRWAKGFLSAFCRSFAATIAPMWVGAPERRMYDRTCGAKYPPAPACTGMMNGTAIDSAHIALDSDCFSNATVRTRSWIPASTRDAATIAVEPPTEPAVCTRSNGLPGAPSASAR